MQPLNRALAALNRLLRTLSPNCREASRLQSEALDHPLTTGQRIGLRIHLVLCGWCRRYGRQLGFLHKASKRAATEPDTSSAATLSNEARERIRRAVRDSDESV